MSDRVVRWSFALSLLVLALYALARIELSTDITSFMPRESDAELAVLASQLADSELTRTMILTLEASELDLSVEVARELADRLADHPEVASIGSGVDPAELESFYRIYFPRRHAFLSEDPEREIPLLLSEESLRRRAAEARASLALPQATLTKRLLAEDPLGAFQGILTRLQGQQPLLESHRGHFVTRDRRHAVIFLTTRHSAFDSQPQEALLNELDAGFQAALARHPDAGLALEASGSNRFAVAAERSMRRDVVRIAAVSFLGVAIVFLLFLRSLHYFALAVLPPLSGILFAAVVTHLVLGRIDGLTLAFGASLVGVAIDYSIHVIDHHRLDPDASPRGVVARLRPSLVLGAVTTMASFAGLLLTSFPGFREIGMLAILGVSGSLAVTLFALPSLLSIDARPPPRTATRVAARFADALDALLPRRRALAVGAAAWVLATSACLPGLRFDDDLSRLMSMDPALQAEEERVRARVARSDSGRVLLALGSDEQQAVANNDRLAERLEAAQSAGAIGSYRSLHALLWSESLQRRNLETLHGLPRAAERVEEAFHAEGFADGALAPFRRSLEAAPPAPLSAAELRDSPLGALLSPLLLQLGDRHAAVSYLSEVPDPEALQGHLAGLEGVHLFDQQRFLDSIYGEFRATTLQQLAVGCLLVMGVLWLRYRVGRRALAAFLPAGLAALTLLAGFALAGVGVNLLHVTSLILVMGMGVDYGIFVVDSARDRRHLEATLLSLVLACLTTVFVFGTLALSEHGALRAIGATTGLGVLCSLLFAPLSRILLPAPSAEAAE